MLSSRLLASSVSRVQALSGRPLAARLRGFVPPARLQRTGRRSYNSGSSQPRASFGSDSAQGAEASAVSWLSGLLVGLGTVAASATVAYASADPQDDKSKQEAAQGTVLPLSTIRQLISRHEQVHFLPKTEGAHIDQVQISWYAANSPVEDTHRVAHHGELNLDGGSLFGVFDGHSGTAASAFCRDELFNFLSWHFTKNAKPAHEDDFSQLLSPQAFVDADNAFLSLSIEDDKLEDGRSGACVNVVHVRGDQITVANAGDCRAVLGRESSSGVYQAVALSMDHQIDFNPAESERLIREHPHEPDIIAKNRVKGRLQPTRGMGDGPYKRIEFFWPRQELRDRYAETGWNPPYTTAKPDIKHHRLRPDDKFLVLATDGLFQDLDSHQVVKYVGEYLNKHHNLCPPEGHAPSAEALGERVTSAASFLVEKALLHAAINEKKRAEYRRSKALAQGAIYNSGFLSVSSEHELLSAIVQLPPAIKRNVHDDTTVMVLFFKDIPLQHHDFAHSQLAKGSHEPRQRLPPSPAPTTPLTPFLSRWVARGNK